MTVGVYYFNIGQGIYNTDISGGYLWGKHSFNPTSNESDGSQTWDIFANPFPPETGPTNIISYNVSLDYDIWNYQYGNEVVMSTLVLVSDAAAVIDLTIDYRDPDGDTAYTYSEELTFPGVSWTFRGIGIGIKYGDGDWKEISKDGLYSARYRFTYISGGSGTVSGSKEFDVIGFPTVTGSSDIGSIWVEGDNLCFISYDGYKIKCQHDGTVYASGQTPGYIWLETNGKISYIDADGDERKTKLGDRYGYGGWASEIPGNPGVGNKGHIWTCNDNNDTYLIIVSDNGIKYRIGAGFVDTGDYQ